MALSRSDKSWFLFMEKTIRANLRTAIKLQQYLKVIWYSFLEILLCLQRKKTRKSPKAHRLQLWKTYDMVSNTTTVGLTRNEHTIRRCLKLQHKLMLSEVCVCTHRDKRSRFYLSTRNLILVLTLKSTKVNTLTCSMKVLRSGSKSVQVISSWVLLQEVSSSQKLTTKSTGTFLLRMPQASTDGMRGWSYFCWLTTRTLMMKICGNWFRPLG